MIVTGCEVETDALKEIWRECFHDSKEYIEFFFRNRYIPKDTIVYKEDGRAVSVIYALKAEMKRNGVYHPIRYLYAVSTLQEFRSRGYSTKLLEECNRRYPEGTVLVPASERLFGFYKNCGYQISSYTKMCEYAIETLHCDTKLIITRNVEASAYKKSRDDVYDGEGYVRWDEGAIQYALDENMFTGGINVRVSDGKQCFYMILSFSQNSIIIKEATSLEDTLVLYAAKVLGLEKGCQKVIWRKSASPLNGTPYAMAYGCCEVDGYIALVLD